MEHGFQSTKAATSNRLDIVKEIKEALTPALARNLHRKVTYNPVWEKIKDGVMLELQWEKHVQHPELGEELIKTEGLKLMEASPYHDYSGTGCLIDDPAIDKEEFPGKNKLGDSLEEVRDRLIRHNLNE